MAMMTIVTTVTLKQDGVAQWDRAMHARETREHLAGLEDGPPQTLWYDVVEVP